MSNRTRRNANEARRQLAARKQTPLHMRGMSFHAASGGNKVPGQLDRAEARAKAHAEAYPDAPVYRTDIGNDDRRADGMPGPVLLPAPTVTAFAEAWEDANWLVYQSPRGKVFALPLVKRDKRGIINYPGGMRNTGSRTAHPNLADGSRYLGVARHCSMSAALRFIKPKQAKAA